MLKFKVFCFFLLILLIEGICWEDHLRNKRNNIQQLQRKNRQNIKHKENKMSLTPKRSNKNKLVQKEKRYVTQSIPGLGSVRGRTIMSEWSGKHIFQFFDIPYAKSPSGFLRFKPPIPVTPWSNVLNAQKPYLGCPSLYDFVSYEILESENIDVEDCLRLTINTKSFSGNAPVMVYVHGNFLNDGNSLATAPGYLLEENVVLVGVRYRLGPFGFLSTMSDDIPGNVGVKDVILALQWIQDHIAAFGGDPGSVTLFGQVDGAALINVLTMSPLVPDNLFHRVIYHSASALSPAFVTDNPLPVARNIGQIAGCKNINKVNSLNKCLRKLNATNLLESFLLQASNINQRVGSLGSVQFVVGGPSGMLPHFPSKILTSGDFRAYPTLGGTVMSAGTFILRDIYVDNFNETIVDDSMNGMDYVNLVISQTNGADPSETWKKYAEKEVFSPEILKNGTFYVMAPGLIDLCGTIAFKNPVLLAMQGNAQKLPNSTYLYSFDYEGEFNRYEDDMHDMPFELGVALADDNLYLFPWPRYLLLNLNRDIKIARRMVSFWTSFAATGKPSAPNVPDWPAMNDETGPYIKIGKTVSVGANYIDEFSATVREHKNGFNLVNEEFFESLIDVHDKSTENGQNRDNGAFNEEGRGNIVLIAKRTKQT